MTRGRTLSGSSLTYITSGSHPSVGLLVSWQVKHTKRNLYHLLLPSHSSSLEKMFLSENKTKENPSVYIRVKRSESGVVVDRKVWVPFINGETTGYSTACVWLSCYRKVRTVDPSRVSTVQQDCSRKKSYLFLLIFVRFQVPDWR